MDFRVLFNDEHLNRFRSFLIQEEKSEGTIEKYLRDVKAFAGFMKNRELTKENILEYKKHLMDNYAASSVNSMLIAGNRFLEFMDLPEYKVKLMRRQRRLYRNENQELTKCDYMKLLHAAIRNKDEKLSLIIQTICSTGIRISELKYFTVRVIKNGKIEIYNKGKSRVIFIPKHLRLKLQKYIKKNKIEKGVIFLSKNNRPLDRINIWRQMKKLCRAAGVSEEKVYPHNLRHLFARTYYKIEKDIMKLADILGHSSIDTTRIYTITTGKEQEKQMERLGLIL